jgi:hypothetical protein
LTFPCGIPALLEDIRKTHADQTSFQNKEEPFGEETEQTATK